MRRYRRLVVAILVGLTSTLVSFVLLHWHGAGAGDFTWSLGGARALLHGIDPYTNPAFGPGKPYPYNSVLYYPLPALIVALPFTFMPRYLAGALFFGTSSALLAYVLTRDGYSRLPLFLSAPFFVAAFVAQWSPLIMAAALVPWLFPLAIVKPNLGLALGVAYPKIRAFVISAAILVLSLLIMPSWPLQWLRNLGHSHHLPPILIMPGYVLSHHLPIIFVVPGVVLLYAAVAWRRPAGRLLLMMAIVPQFAFFYDQLPLWLIPDTWWQSVVLTAASWIGFGGWAVLHWGHTQFTGPWIALCIYIPALTLILWQQWWPNRSTVPDIEPVPAMAGGHITGSH